MPGIPTHFAILEETIERLAGDAALAPFAATMRDHRAYAHLGALGAALGDYIPFDPTEEHVNDLDQPPYVRVWKPILAIARGELFDPQIRGFLQLADQAGELLPRLEDVAAREDEAALRALYDGGQTKTLDRLAQESKYVLDKVEERRDEVDQTIRLSAKPRAPASPGLSPRDILHWERTGQFARALLDRAEATGDPRFRAYAYGFLIGYAADVCGAPFVNSIVRGPYRTQWWRHRWVGNHVDTWAHGFYALRRQGTPVTMAGDTPSIPYEQWPRLCGARLHERIAIPGAAMPDPFDIMARIQRREAFPEVLPSAFRDFWFGAYVDTYGYPTAGGAAEGSPYGFTAQRLNDAYLLAWLILWFQTRGGLALCNERPPAAPPECGAAPPWVTVQQVPGDNGFGMPPPPPDLVTSPDEGDTVSGIILAALGALAGLHGALQVGAAGIGIGIGLLLGEQPGADWGKLRCHLAWYRLYLYNFLAYVHAFTTAAAFTFPYPEDQQSIPQEVRDLLGVDDAYDAAPRVVKSRITREDYPAKPWPATESDWLRTPNSAAEADLELPRTFAYLEEAYPDYFIDDDAANPLTAGEVKAGVPPPALERTNPRAFGNAVANAVDLFRHLGGDLPDWNRDGDRGIAWVHWYVPGGAIGNPGGAVRLTQ